MHNLPRLEAHCDNRLACKWLLVLDNADDAEILVNVLPSGANGSILITSRNSSAGFGIATKILHIQPFSAEAGTTALLTLTSRNAQSASERISASKIAEMLGGLPLAINQMSGFILQQRLSLNDFLSLYEKNSAKINSRKARRTDYNHTLSTVWEVSLTQLSGPSSTLQKMLPFFDPDKIPESILRSDDKAQKGNFEFLDDDME